jgi:hypothetical protein
VQKPGHGIEHVDVLLAHAQQVMDVVLGDHVAFPEGRALELAGDDAGDVVTQDHAHGIGHGHLAHSRFAHDPTSRRAWRPVRRLATETGHGRVSVVVS